MAATGFKFTGFFNMDNAGPGQQDIIIPNRILSGSLAFEVEENDIEGRVDGNCATQIVGTTRLRETYTLSFATRDIDSHFLQLLLDETWGLSSTYDQKYINTAPSSASGLVLDAEIAGVLNPTTVRVSLAETSGTSLMRPLQVITTGTPTAEQALVEPGQITLAAENAGQAVKYSVDKALTNVETIGHVNNPKALTNMAFDAKICNNFGEDLFFKVRKMTRNGNFTLGLQGDEDTTLEYKCVALPGYRKPVEFMRRAMA